MKLEQYLLTVVMKYMTDMNIEQKSRIKHYQIDYHTKTNVNDKYNKIPYFIKQYGCFFACMLCQCNKNS